MALTEYVFVAWAMFIVNARNGARLRNYTGSLRSEHIIGRLLFRLPDKIVDALTYSGL